LKNLIISKVSEIRKQQEVAGKIIVAFVFI